MKAWFDAGINLFNPRFSLDREQVLANAWHHGLSGMLLISSDIEESELQQAYALSDPRLYCTAGVHPHQADQVQADWICRLSSLLQQPSVVAVGECGLDFNRNYSTPQNQIQVFEAQLQLASEHNKAIYLHERDAFTTQYQMLQRYQGLAGVAHCFTGDKAQLKAYLDLGLYIGITGWLCDEKRGQSLREAVRYLPLDRLILETDAPFLLPKTLVPKPKSSRNEPAYLSEIAIQFASLTGYSLDDIAAYSRKNSQVLFQITADEYPL